MGFVSHEETQPLFSFHNEYSNWNWLFFPFEKNFEPNVVLVTSKKHKCLGPAFCLAYLLFVYYGPKYMKNRKPYDLKKALQYWNLFMAIISTWGMLRVLPHLLLYVSTVGFKASFCIPPRSGFGHGALGFWSTVFIYSKFIELVDTIFLVLRKRPLTFLHWYHHLTVLGFSWHAFLVEQPVGIYFCAMNYIVHSIMYSYYYCASVGKDASWFAVYVTTAQIAQMFIGAGITLAALFFVSQPSSGIPSSNPWLQQNKCIASKTNLYAALGVYISYLYLFCLFFWNRYFTVKKLVD